MNSITAGYFPDLSRPAQIRLDIDKQPVRHACTAGSSHSMQEIPRYFSTLVGAGGRAYIPRARGFFKPSRRTAEEAVRGWGTSSPKGREICLFTIGSAFYSF